MKAKKIYDGCTIALATMHKKESVIEPIFNDLLGASLVVPTVNTDALGTFSPEKQRSMSQKDTVIEKALLGMHAAGVPIGLANEGSFGPHPLFPFGYVGYELMAFVDRARGFTLVEELIAEKTNFNSVTVGANDDITQFLKSVQFPSHALIVFPDSATDRSTIFKGLNDLVGVRHAIAESCRISLNNQARVETDMRAHMNPTRMKAIANLANKMAQRLKRICPACKNPGFGVTEKIYGLPCAWCAQPTELLKQEIMGCSMCAHTKIKNVTGARVADPYHCTYCNP